jgi:hypothetical protein
MLTKDTVLAGLRIQFPEVEESHLNWAAVELFAAYETGENRTNEIFFQKVEDGLRACHEGAIQIALASVKLLAA